jgi:hypothetical protein
MFSKETSSVGKRRSRSTARLGRHLEKNLLAYAAAAGAGLLSASLPAEAEIIYTPCNTPMALAKVNEGPALTSLDLTNNGNANFGFVMSATKHYTYSGTTAGFKYFLKVVPGAGNAVVQGGRASLASAVPAGVRVGPQEKFGTGDQYLMIKSYNNGYRNSGTWQQVEYAYVGLRFLIDGQVHYGWARIKFPFAGGFGIPYPSIYGYAYESTPNQPIVTGQTGESSPTNTKASVPSTLGMLAVGASGLEAWRK